MGHQNHQGLYSWFLLGRYLNTSYVVHWDFNLPNKIVLQYSGIPDMNTVKRGARIFRDQGWPNGIPFCEPIQK